MHESFVAGLDTGEKCLDDVEDRGFFGEEAGWYGVGGGHGELTGQEGKVPNMGSRCPWEGSI